MRRCRAGGISSARRCGEIVRLSYAHTPPREPIDSSTRSASSRRRCSEHCNDLQRAPGNAQRRSLARFKSRACRSADFNAVAWKSLARIFMSPGNIYDPQGEGVDFWRFAPGMTAAGFRQRRHHTKHFFLSHDTCGIYVRWRAARAWVASSFRPERGRPICKCESLQT